MKKSTSHNKVIERMFLYQKIYVHFVQKDRRAAVAVSTLLTCALTYISAVTAVPLYSFALVWAIALLGSTINALDKEIIL
ncbi:hypothetical protein [Vibrio phage JSF12]|uniref:Uncharacterized protein n=3 Tax=Jesfedecavirus TaxID=2560156 RepID=A0A2D0Z189_9CAUD|nr:hypothetical protein AVV29_gp148 [Vibrio phage phi 3]YP_009618420.1 hypothetical protein FDI98_gp139 [Vibrio phage JSF10]YP_009794720.1 hypothetical protein HOS35_gp037 [Vibrio phage JSF12]AJF40830.1 hypothetical protein SBVP3_0063 [Vibrio phage phi 3]ASV43393.1 hypothetical protein [Vibrio phage JSF10]ASV43555.1 hypothetical protein [Vibrio phage JSF12]